LIFNLIGILFFVGMTFHGFQKGEF